MNLPFAYLVTCILLICKPYGQPRIYYLRQHGYILFSVVIIMSFCFISAIFCVIYYSVYKLGCFRFWSSARWRSLSKRSVCMLASTWTMTRKLWDRAWMRKWPWATRHRTLFLSHSSAAPQFISRWLRVTGCALRRSTPVVRCWPNVNLPSGRWRLFGIDLIIQWNVIYATRWGLLIK